jgi:hypothetical protein
MCDYSLMGVPSRLARNGEELIVYTFPTSTKGLATADDVAAEQSRRGSLSIWESIKRFLCQPKLDTVTAVCIPPGARLILLDVPRSLQVALEIEEIELVTFTQLTAAANAHRDAIRFKNGRELSLQTFTDGQRVKIMDLDLDQEHNAYTPEGIGLISNG